MSALSPYAVSLIIQANDAKLGGFDHLAAALTAELRKELGKEVGP